uniref:Kelch repeat and BTB domain containing 3 n=1 Tax=Equus asinus TaxID=9793 RepID=A0A9L0IFJ7_EQUAS
MDNSYDFNRRNSCNGIPSEKKNSFLVSEDHGQKILSVLQNFREQNVFYDFKIIMKDETIPCHRCVLAACSDFFRYFSLSIQLCLIFYDTDNYAFFYNYTQFLPHKSMQQ